jgi:hypothetical protein
MQTARSFLEKILFPGWAQAPRRRQMRFFLIAMVLAVCLSAGFGVVLYVLNCQGRI